MEASNSQIAPERLELCPDPNPKGACLTPLLFCPKAAEATLEVKM